MKTLIFNGSPRPNGDTVTLIRALCEELPGEVKVIDAYRAGIRPCIDCRRCWTQVGCVIHDGMQEVCRDIAAADCIVIASPVYFSCLTGPLLSLMSRLQVFYTARRFLGVRLIEGEKVGVILLCGGGDGSPSRAEDTALGLLRCMRASHMGTVITHKTDTLPAAEDAALLAEVRELGRKLAAACR